MSYSRWSNSHWYTYHDATSINHEKTLTIVDVGSFPLSTVKNKRKEIMELAKNYGKPSEDDIKELEEILDYFIYDMEDPNSQTNILNRLVKDDL